MRLSRWLSLGLLAVLLFAGLLAAVEYVLQQRDRPPEPTDQPKWETLQAAHAPFSIQHIHPFYQFFFPLDPAQRQALSNDAVQLSAAGYRGATPAQRGRRKLAFLLGDSVVFGFAAHDTTTITGYLNQIQQEYLFVNAGVPSWNTTQALTRLVLDVLPQQPDLVVGWGGYNDASQTYHYWQSGRPFPPGTPEGFDRLYDTFDDLRGPLRQTPAWYARWLPALTARVQARLAPPAPPQGTLQAAAARGARQFMQHLSVMARATQGHRAQFVGVFQPILSLHAHVDPRLATDGRPDFGAFLTAFHGEVAAAPAPPYPFADYHRLFDQHYNSIPVFTPGRGPDLAEQVFVDLVHLYEPGNRIIAETLWRQIQSLPPTAEQRQ